MPHGSAEQHLAQVVAQTAARRAVADSAIALQDGVDLDDAAERKAPYDRALSSSLDGISGVHQGRLFEVTNHRITGWLPKPLSITAREVIDDEVESKAHYCTCKK